MPSYDYFPKPIGGLGPHEVVMRDGDTHEVIAIGHGEDDAAALWDLVTILIAGNANRRQIKSAAHQYRVAHKRQTGTEPPFDNAPQYCPACGVSATDHPSGECLDRWVQQAFLAEEVTQRAAPPRYSEATGVPYGAVNALVRHLGWPHGWVAIPGGGGVLVGEQLTVQEDGIVAVRAVASGPTFELAVCRAAAATPPWGDYSLQVRLVTPH